MQNRLDGSRNSKRLKRSWYFNLGQRDMALLLEGPPSGKQNQLAVSTPLAN